MFLNIQKLYRCIEPLMVDVNLEKVTLIIVSRLAELINLQGTFQSV